MPDVDTPDDLVPWGCEDCGWSWPAPGAPPASAECDHCGGRLVPEVMD